MNSRSRNQRWKGNDRLPTNVRTVVVAEVEEGEDEVEAGEGG
jgi:hypothetical protein